MKQAPRGYWEEPPPENSTAYHDYLEEGRGEAMYVATMLCVYAVSIAFMIGYMSFKKNKYRQWDREANQYLNGYYKRQIKHEKTRLQTFADTFNPSMTMLFATGLAFGNVGRSQSLATQSAAVSGGSLAPSANGAGTSLGASGAWSAAAGQPGTAATAAERAGPAAASALRRSSRDRVSTLNEITEEDDICGPSGGRSGRHGSHSKLIIPGRAEAAIAGGGGGATTHEANALLEQQTETKAEVNERLSSYEIV